MPRGPADRPIRVGDDEAALQAGMRRALEQGAASVPGVGVPEPAPPSFGRQVAQPAPVRVSSGVVRAKGARSFSPVRPRKRKEAPGGDPVPDPRGRGRKVDLRS